MTDSRYANYEPRIERKVDPNSPIQKLLERKWDMTEDLSWFQAELPGIEDLASD